MTKQKRLVLYDSHILKMPLFQSFIAYGHHGNLKNEVDCPALAFLLS